MSKTGFPEELLNKSIQERKDYFNSYIIAHPFLKKADSELRDAIKNTNSQSLVFVYGPSGVGKTTLITRVVNLMIEQANKGEIPVVNVEVIPPDGNTFGWQDYYKRALRALEEPLIDYKINYETKYVKRDGQGCLVISPQGRRADLRYALENAFKYRNVRTCLLDEAQHLTKLPTGKKWKNQLDIIKSLANNSKTLHVLVGTYELQSFKNLSGQLDRRTRNVHFPRYRTYYSKDIEVFIQILNQFQYHLPVKKKPDLVGRWEFFYERTIGCIGTLKTWLYNALAAALDEGEEKITMQQLKRHSLSVLQCENMAREAIQGESKEEENEQTVQSLRVLLELESSEGLNPQSEERKNNSRRVGERSPGRDPVGVEENV